MATRWALWVASALLLLWSATAFNAGSPVFSTPAVLERANGLVHQRLCLQRRTRTSVSSLSAARENRAVTRHVSRTVVCGAQQQQGGDASPPLTVGQVRDVFNALSVVVIEAVFDPLAQRFDGVGPNSEKTETATKIKVKDLPKALELLGVSAANDDVYQEMRALVPGGDEGLLGLADFVRFVQTAVQSQPE